MPMAVRACPCQPRSSSSSRRVAASAAVGPRSPAASTAAPASLSTRECGGARQMKMQQQRSGTGAGQGLGAAAAATRRHSWLTRLPSPALPWPAEKEQPAYTWANKANTPEEEALAAQIELHEAWKAGAGLGAVPSQWQGAELLQAYDRCVRLSGTCIVEACLGWDPGLPG